MTQNSKLAPELAVRAGSPGSGPYTAPEPRTFAVLTLPREDTPMPVPESPANDSDCPVAIPPATPMYTAVFWLDREVLTAISPFADRDDSCAPFTVLDESVYWSLNGKHA